jgi:hypothetical protein
MAVEKLSTQWYEKFMYALLLLTHSVLRYFVLIMLLVVIIRSFMRWQSKASFDKMDDRFGLVLFIFTHTQVLIGTILYFVSPWVIFSATSMSDKVYRYWLVEHGTGMTIAIVLITVARISAKKMTDASAKHKRMFIFNFIAILVILTIIGMSQRGFFGITQ